MTDTTSTPTAEQPSATAAPENPYAAPRTESSAPASATNGFSIASLVLGALGEPALGTLVSGALAWFDLRIEPGHPALRWISLIIAFTTITIFHMTLGEQAPKMWALRHAEATSLAISLPRWRVPM